MGGSESRVGCLGEHCVLVVATQSERPSAEAYGWIPYCDTSYVLCDAQSGEGEAREESSFMYGGFRSNAQDCEKNEQQRQTARHVDLC